MAYNFDEIYGEEPAQPSTAPAAPPARLADGGYDFDSIYGAEPATATPQAATQASIYDASFGNPDEAAQRRQVARDLEKFLGDTTPASVIDIPDAQRRLRVAEADHATRASPRTSAWLSNADNAKIAADDAKTLANIERILDDFQHGRLSEPTPDYSWGAKKGLLAGSAKSGLESLRSTVAKVFDAANPFGMSDEELAVLYRNDPEGLKRQREGAPNFLKRIAAREAEQASKTMQDLPRSGYSDLRYDTLGENSAWRAPTKILADALQSMPSTIALAVTGLMARGAAASTEARALSGGASAEAARAAGIAAAAKAGAVIGGTSEGVQAYGQSAAALQSELEKLPEAELLKSPLYSSLIDQGYSPEAARLFTAAHTAEQTGRMGGVTTGLLSAAGGMYLGKIIGEGGGLFARTAKGAAAEALTEAPQSGLEQFWQNLAKQQNIDPNQDLTEDVANAVLQGLAVGSATGGPMAAMAGRGEAKIKAELGAQTLQELFAAAEQSLTRGRDTQTFDAFFQDVAGDATVFVDPIVLRQAAEQAGIDETRLPSLTEQSAEAANVGAGVEIPVAELVSAFTGTGIEQQIIENTRMAPDAATLAEVRADGTKALEFFQAEAAKALEQATQQEEFRTAAETVRNDVLTEIKAAAPESITTPQQEGYASLVGAFYSTIASRVGVTPLQLRDGWTDAAGVQHRGYRLGVLNEQMRAARATGQQFDQTGKLITDTPAFKEWFGDSKVVDAEGKPLVVYHGTSTAFHEFDPEKTTQDEYGQGFYFTEYPEVAGNYASGGGANIMPVFVSLKNPAVVRGAFADGDLYALAGTNRRSELTAKLKEKGFDGVIREQRGGKLEIVAFDPTQIKSVFNRGTFSRTDPNILLQSANDFLTAFDAADTIELVAPTTSEEEIDRAQDEFLSHFPKTGRYPRDTRLLARIRRASEKALDALDGSPETDREIASTLGPFSAYNVGAEVLEGDSLNPNGSLRVTIFGKEQVEAGLTDEPALTITVTAGGELTLNGPSPNTATFEEFKARGWADYARGADGTVQTGWSALKDPANPDKPLPITQILPLLADTHARVREWRGEDYVGLHWTRATGALGGLFDQDESAVFFQPAYHGSPYRFDKFSLEHLGKGEGAQAFGWGLYFAGKREVAEYYRKTLAEQQYFIDGTPINATDPVHIAAATLAFNAGDRAAAINNLRAEAVTSYSDDAQKKTWAAAADILERGDDLPAVTDTQGQLYEVEIPEDGGYLLWDKPLSEQPEKVRKALGAKIVKGKIDPNGLDMGGGAIILDNRNGQADPNQVQPWVLKSGDSVFGLSQRDVDRMVGEQANATGENIYTRLSAEKGGQEAASKYLHSLGIAGIKYADASARGKTEDSFNYVIFDENAVEIAQTFYQQQAPAQRGAFSPRTLDISFLANADASTFLHETGHFFLTVYADLASQTDAPAEIKADMDALLQWFDGGRTLDEWNALPIDQQRPYHEQFAETFEQYLFTGKAPTKELQPLFRRFAKWLTSVYGSIRDFVARNKGAKLNEEVSAIFDRMIATDAEIEAMRAARAYTQLFRNAAEAGMSPADFAAYQALDPESIAEAEEQLRTRGLRDMKWLQNRRNKIIAELQEDAKARRAEVRAEVEKEVAERPLYRAMKWLKRGEMTTPEGEEIKAEAGHKLRIADVEAIFPTAEGVDLRKLGYGRYGMLAEEGLPPDMVADMFEGFTSGETLVRQLLDAPKFSDEVEGLTNQRMLEQYGDLSSPQDIERAADEAIHNDARTRMVATELHFLGKSIGKPGVLIKAAREYARQIVETKSLKTLKPANFAAEETRAGKAAMEALRKGDREEAARLKRTELLNHAAAKEAYAAAKEMEKIVNRLKKIADTKDEAAARSREMDMVNATRAILAEFGIGRHGAKAAAYLKTVEKLDPDMSAALDDIIAETAANARDYRTLPLRELRELGSMVDAIWSMALSAKQVQVEGKRLQLDDVRRELADKLLETAKAPKKPKGLNLTKAETAKVKFARLATQMKRPEAWVGMKDGADTFGPWRRYIWKIINDAQTALTQDKAARLKQMKDLVRPVLQDMIPQRIEAPEIGVTFGASDTLGYSELLHALLHTGNESNKRKLLLGRGWATERADGSLDTTKWDALIARMHKEGKLTKRHWDFVQSVWDFMEDLKPGAQRAHKEAFGRYFDEVTAAPIDTPFGQYKGGYVPAKADTLQVSDADRKAMVEAGWGNMLKAFPTSRRGFTKGRSEDYNVILELNLQSLTRHVDEVLTFTHMNGPVRDVQRILKGGELSSVLAVQDREAINYLILPWLQHAAQQTVTLQGNQNWENWKIWSKLRSRTGAAIMFANLKNVTQQLTSFFPAMLKVKPTYLLHSAATNILAPRDLAKHVAAMSPYMNQRINDETYALASEIDDILLNPTKLESAQQWSMKHAYFLQMAVDNWMAPTIWLAKYNETMESAPAGMTEAEIAAQERKAIELADSAVRMTQGAMRPIDVAAFEGGSPFARMFTQFAGFFSTQINMMGEQAVIAQQMPNVKQKYARLGMIAFLGWYAPAIASEIISVLFAGGPPDEDKDGEYLDDWLRQILVSGPVKYATAMVPIAGQGIQAVVNAFNDKPYDDRLGNAPAVGALESAGKAAGAAYKLATDPDYDPKPGPVIRDTGMLLSILTGLPVLPAAKSIGYLIDVESGRVSPTSPADLVRGTITGVASPESKQ